LQQQGPLDPAGDDVLVRRQPSGPAELPRKMVDAEMGDGSRLPQTQAGLEVFLDLLDARDARPLLLMSHHFITSAWNEEPSPALAAQLRDRIRGRVFAWYWGHEHGCAAYKRVRPYGYYGALVGNGAFRERRTAPRVMEKPIEWHPVGRCSCYGKGGPHFWPHGYLELELRPASIVEMYHVESQAEPYMRTLQPPRAKMQ
jgi:hypothetical protein